jgi:hypothetical protein
MSKTPKAKAPKWVVSQVRRWAFAYHALICNTEASGDHDPNVAVQNMPSAASARRVARQICAALNGPKPTTKPRKERTK